MRKVIANLLSLLIVSFLFGTTGCSSGSGGSGQPTSGGPASGTALGNDLEVTTGEQPSLKEFPGGAVVHFAAQGSGPMEAWEVDTDNNQTFLNYSRFPFGTVEYQGQPTQLCTAVVAGYKYAGVSENRARLKKAMVVAMMFQVKTLPASISCTAYSDVAAQYPTRATVFESLK